MDGFCTFADDSLNPASLATKQTSPIPNQPFNLDPSIYNHSSMSMSGSTAVSGQGQASTRSEPPKRKLDVDALPLSSPGWEELVQNVK